MKKEINLKLIIVISIIVFSGVSYLFINLNKEGDLGVENKKEEIVNTETNIENWVSYTNKELGVKFLHPKTINGSEMVFFKVRNVLFVTTADSKIYKMRNQINPEIYTTPASIVKKGEDIAYGDPKTFEFKHWAIIVEKASSKEDISNLIEKNVNKGLFGGSTKCVLKEIHPSKMEGVQEVIYGPEVVDEENIFNSDCVTNYMARFKYSEKYGLTAFWIIGQENAFVINDCDTDNKLCDIDYRIADTFEFIK